jgi:dihydroorotase
MQSPRSHAGDLTITRPDDWHVHLREGAVLQAVLADTARQFARAIIMPNLRPPVTTVAAAAAYRTRILAAMKATGIAPEAFQPLMTLYLTDNTTAAEIRAAHASGFVHAVKLYPAGATTNSDAGVTDLQGRCGAALEALQENGMPLLVHGEVTDSDVDLFDREAAFIDRVLIPLRNSFPELRVVLEHVTTQEGVDYVESADSCVAATITAHHLLYNRNALFLGGLRPHWYCLPVLKREKHRRALLDAATGGSGKFFLGTDSAPHSRRLKEQGCGCAGCYTALHAMPLYATAFDSVGRLDRLEAFASLNGPAFYKLPVNRGTLTLHRGFYEVPAEVPFGNGASIVPLAAGEQLGWRLGAGNQTSH